MPFSGLTVAGRSDGFVIADCLFISKLSKGLGSQLRLYS